MSRTEKETNPAGPEVIMDAIIAAVVFNTEPTVTRTETGVVIEQTETERVSPAYAPFETYFRKTVSIVSRSDRCYVDVRTTRNGIITGAHTFPANAANRGTLAFFVGDELADELLAAVSA